MPKKIIMESDVIDIDSYIKDRESIKKRIKEHKSSRRVHVGPHATFYFESFDTMLYQVQEMLFIERGGREQLEDELKAYNPLIPNGQSLVATLMFEIDNPGVRKNFLNSIGGIEQNTFIQIQDQKIYSRAENDTNRTNEKGKASSVHFLHFEFDESKVKLFTDKNSEVSLGFDHENYHHISILSSIAKKSLVEDFDLESI
jgi:hypothetical protein